MERYAPGLDEFPTERMLRPRHIVIVHNDGEYVAELQERLTQCGCAVHLARNGEQARLLARRWRADVVVLDSEMPFESGWLTADKLWRENREARAVVVAPEVTFRDRQLAQFVQAYSIVDRLEGIEAVLDIVGELDRKSARLVAASN